MQGKDAYVTAFWQTGTCTRRSQTSLHVSFYEAYLENFWLINEDLDDLIDDMAELVKTHYNIVELADPSSASEASNFMDFSYYNSWDPRD